MSDTPHAGPERGHPDGAAERRASPRGLLAAAFVPALIGVVLVAVLTARSGPGVSPDSVVYLAAARSLLDGQGFRGPDGEPYVTFPPLFPALIAAASLGRFDLTHAATAVTAASFGIVILTAGLLAGRSTGSAAAAAMGALAVLISTPVLDAALHIWSETPLIALTMIGLGALMAPAGRDSRRTALIATVSASLAALTRYIGVVSVLTQVIVATAGWSGAARIRRIGVALAGLIPVLLWLLRDVIVSGTPAGERSAAAASLIENGQAAVETLLRWSVPVDLSMRVRALLVLLTGGALLAWVLSHARRSDRPGWTVSRSSLAPAVYCLLYLVYLVVTASLTAVDPIDGRLIAPVIPVAVVLIVSCTAAVRTSGTRSGAAGRTAALLLLLWLAASTLDTALFIRRTDTDGIGGYAAPAWADSATLNYIERHLPPGALYSNDPFAVFYHTGREARLSPRRHPYRSPNAVVDDLPGVRRSLESDAGVYLIWFDRVPRDFLLSPADLAMILELETVARLDDGTVYRIR